ncbi:MAG: hypothetical protein CEE38_14185 [Planctomycetes bacterium B3_Pla]|nr:MAG: hypothetical protein CEE38_14185 [Planctomycetes bacterium B3_Pla]
MVFIVSLQATKTYSLKKSFFAANNAFPALLTRQNTFLCFSAKKQEKLYLFMGRANKNANIRANRCLRAGAITSVFCPTIRFFNLDS